MMNLDRLKIKLLVGWLGLTVLLIIPYLLSRRVELEETAVLKQLLILYTIDSLLFFLVVSSHTKMVVVPTTSTVDVPQSIVGGKHLVKLAVMPLTIGILTLIFLLTIEILAIIYYSLALYGGITPI